MCIDLPGGGPENNESPFDTFCREIYEEFGLQLTRSDIVYARKYPSILEQGKFTYFPVVQLPPSAFDKIQFGDEGVEYMLMSFGDFVNSSEIAWPALQERAADYISFLSSK
ncbi:MAG: NUDIX domain-containing protein [Candidatus Microsaccharimonas sp.]